MTVKEPELKPMFSYLGKEMSFQGAAATLSFAGAAWILKEIAFSTEVGNNIGIRGLVLIRIAALFLFAAGAFFFFQRGQISRWNGNLAKNIALGIEIDKSVLDTTVRKISDPEIWQEWWQYYVGRICLLLGGALVIAAMSGLFR
jgi:hypothetical protein